MVSSVLFKPGTSIRSAGDFGKMIAALTRDDFKRMASDLNAMAAQAKSAGHKLAYRNHNVEFRTWTDGSTPYATLMAETDPALVKIELDCGWADLADHSPFSIFRKYAGRVRMLHIKDFKSVPHPIVTLGPRTNPTWTELGEGHMGYRAILAAAPAAGVEYIFVEQEPPYVQFTALEAAKANYEYLQSIG